MTLYEVSIRPDQRVAALSMNLPMWHSRTPPKHLPRPTMYAQQLDTLYTTEKDTYKMLVGRFRDDVEFIKGVVYSPKSEEESGAKPKDKADEAWRICRKKLKTTFM